METKYIIMILVAVVILVVAIILISTKKKKNDKSNEPIHKEYDESIASIVEDKQSIEEPIIENNPPLPVEEQEIIDKNFVLEIQDKPDQVSNFANVGMVAEPIMEEKSIKQEVIETPPLPNVPVPEEIIEIKPEVAQTAEAQYMQDYEIKPQSDNNKKSDIVNITPQEVKKEPMFIYDIPQKEEIVEIQKPNEIQIDIPDMEELK